MDKLTVAYLDVSLVDFDYFNTAQQMRMLQWHALSQQNWLDQFPDNPKVKFQLAHNNQGLFLHFAVEEEFIKAQYVRPNEAVWEDSCVEFFISFDKGVNYYNLEFNVAGTGLIGYGTKIKTERNRLTPELISSVMTATSIVSQQNIKRWSMLLYIPTAVFVHNHLPHLSGLSAQANFYKCGDGLPNPHFLSWNAIDWPKPNFHLPEFFGEIVFA